MACVDTTQEHFTSAPGAPVLRFDAMPLKHSAELTFRQRIGSADGPDSEVFGFIGDAIFGPARTIFVADPMSHRIVQFDSGGRFIRYIGRKGAGPGELLAPVRLDWHLAELIVYDQALGRITVFDTTGAYRRSIPLAAPNLVGDLLAAGDGTYGFTTAVGPTAPFALVDTSGRVHSTVAHAIAGGTRLPRDPPDAGRLCLVSSDTVLFANPWIHEIVAFSADGNRAYLTWQRPSEVLRPTSRADSGPEGHQRAFMLGMGCSSERVAIAYMDRQEGRVYYDILTREGAGVAQFSFNVSTDTLHPGFLGDMTDSFLLTFRGRPYPHLLLYQLTEELP